MPPLAAGAGAPAAFGAAGIVGMVVIVIAGVGVVAGAAGVLGFAGAAGFDAAVTGVVEVDAGVLGSAGLAPLAPAAALVFMTVAGRVAIALGELVSALHAQRLRAPIHRPMDESVLLLDSMFISVLQCVGRFVRLASLTEASTPPGFDHEPTRGFRWSPFTLITS